MKYTIFKSRKYPAFKEQWKLCIFYKKINWCILSLATILLLAVIRGCMGGEAYVGGEVWRGGRGRKIILPPIHKLFDIQIVRIWWFLSAKFKDVLRMLQGWLLTCLFKRITKIQEGWWILFCLKTTYIATAAPIEVQTELKNEPRCPVYL